MTPTLFPSFTACASPRYLSLVVKQTAVFFTLAALRPGKRLFSPRGVKKPGERIKGKKPCQSTGFLTATGANQGTPQRRRHCDQKMGARSVSASQVSQTYST